MPPQLIVLGALKGHPRLLVPPKRLGEKRLVKRNHVVVDHTSRQNAALLVRPAKLLWERHLGDVITGLGSIMSSPNRPAILVAGSATAYVTTLDVHGRNLWT